MKSIVGFWKFKHNRIRQEDGEWLYENLAGGTIAFSESGEALLFVRSEQGPWGYSGKYEMNGDEIKIEIESSVVEDLEGGTLVRKVRFLNDNEMLFSGTEAKTDRLFETHCYRN